MNMNHPSSVWNFKQCFGEKNNPANVQDGDMLTALEFDDTGSYLATGDKAGRVVLFEQDSMDTSDSSYCPSFKFHSEFQSHLQEFDALKSMEIEGKITQIKFLPTTNSSLYVLDSNDKTVKLWRTKLDSEQLQSSGSSTEAKPMKVYKNAHAYHINGIAPRADGDTFISSDDLRIYLWNYFDSNETYKVLDIKPENMDDLTEVITSCDTDPIHPSIFIHSSSRGTGGLYDLRRSSTDLKPCVVFTDSGKDSPKSVGGTNSFFGEILNSISCIKFAKNLDANSDDNYVMARDYLSLKIWDRRKGEELVKQIRFLDHLKPQLKDLYKNENIFDKFDLTIGKGRIATGSYNKEVYVFNNNLNFKKIKIDQKDDVISTDAPRSAAMDINGSSAMDEYRGKALHLAMHPSLDCLAVGIENNLYIYGS